MHSQRAASSCGGVPRRRAIPLPRGVLGSSGGPRQAVHSQPAESTAGTLPCVAALTARHHHPHLPRRPRSPDHAGGRSQPAQGIPASMQRSKLRVFASTQPVSSPFSSSQPPPAAARGAPAPSRSAVPPARISHGRGEGRPRPSWACSAAPGTAPTRFPVCPQGHRASHDAQLHAYVMDEPLEVLHRDLLGLTEAVERRCGEVERLLRVLIDHVVHPVQDNVGASIDIATRLQPPPPQKQQQPQQHMALLGETNSGVEATVPDSVPSFPAQTLGGQRDRKGFHRHQGHSVTGKRPRSATPLHGAADETAGAAASRRGDTSQTTDDSLGAASEVDILIL